MRIIFMGTPEYAVPSLRGLYEAGHEIVLVLTQPDRRGNRGKVTFSPVKEYALCQGLPILQPERIRKDEACMEQLEALEPDMIVVAAFGQILPERVLNIPRFGCINVHGSLLPALRGASPMQGAILKGLDISGVTIMRMDRGIDTGDMIAKAELNITGMNLEELSVNLAGLGGKLLVDTIPSIEGGTCSYEKQDDALSSYAPMIRKLDGLTDFSEDAAVIRRKVLAYTPWPALYSYLDGKQVKFFDVDVDDRAPNGVYGTIAEIGKDYFTINCPNDRLFVRELQMQGKKKMRTADFLRGSRLQEGMRFTL